MADTIDIAPLATCSCALVPNADTVSFLLRAFCMLPSDAETVGPSSSLLVEADIAAFTPIMLLRCVPLPEADFSLLPLLLLTLLPLHVLHSEAQSIMCVLIGLLTYPPSAEVMSAKLPPRQLSSCLPPRAIDASCELCNILLSATAMSKASCRTHRAVELPTRLRCQLPDARPCEAAEAELSSRNLSLMGMLLVEADATANSPCMLPIEVGRNWASVYELPSDADEGELLSCNT